MRMRMSFISGLVVEYLKVNLHIFLYILYREKSSLHERGVFLRGVKYGFRYPLGMSVIF